MKGPRWSLSMLSSTLLSSPDSIPVTVPALFPLPVLHPESTLQMSPELTRPGIVPLEDTACCAWDSCTRGGLAPQHRPEVTSMTTRPALSFPLHRFRQHCLTGSQSLLPPLLSHPPRFGLCGSPPRTSLWADTSVQLLPTHALCRPLVFCPCCLSHPRWLAQEPRPNPQPHPGIPCAPLVRPLPGPRSWSPPFPSSSDLRPALSPSGPADGQPGWLCGETEPLSPLAQVGCVTPSFCPLRL
ncbi:hypothetical protein HJG60_011134 [Phyllostomus discolor]|uniref:Uncharacterized protein n=1 Tax=Phyllostomus discolor TaxID=89673 RepID=A0A834A1V0_9CHIR|nr:hypothetical protein HJG60_011134 [Phyllostomus discolor]